MNHWRRKRRGTCPLRRHGRLQHEILEARLLLTGDDPPDPPGPPLADGDFHWAEGIDGLWSDPFSWIEVSTGDSPSAPPPTDAHVAFPILGADYTVMLDETTSAQWLDVVGGNVVLDTNGHNLNVDEGLQVYGMAQSPSLKILGDGAANGVVDVGFWNVGKVGTGRVIVGGAARVSTGGGGILVGHEGTGTIDVLSAGTILGPGRLTLGNRAAGAGLVTIDGDASQLGSDESRPSLTRVGREGSGAFLVQNGGSAVLRATSIGHDAAGTGLIRVEGVGSTLKVSKDGVEPDELIVGDTFDVVDFIVGESGQGAMEIAAGGIVESGSTIIGNKSGGADYGNKVDVSGIWSRWSIEAAQEQATFLWARMVALIWTLLQAKLK